jgi:hypothetical protein
MFLSTAFLLIVLANSPRVEAAHVGHLIEQLGSPVYAQRQAATKALEAIGEPALEPLRWAYASTQDAEVQKPAGRLVDRLEEALAKKFAKRIWASQLSPEEKGRILKPLLKVGTSEQRVRELLGEPSASHTDVDVLGRGVYYVLYADLELAIQYNQHRSIAIVGVKGD